MPLSWGAVAPSGPPRCSLWPPRQRALHLSCQRRHVVDNGRVGVARERSQWSSQVVMIYAEPGAEKLIKGLGIPTFCVQQDLSRIRFAWCFRDDQKLLNNTVVCLRGK